MASFFDSMKADDWKKFAPQLASFGVNQLSSAQNKKSAEQLLQQQNPQLYSQLAGLATSQMNQAQTFDPNAMAAQELAKTNAIMQPQRDKDLSDVQRILRAKGMLDISNYAGAGNVPQLGGSNAGTAQTWAPTPGQKMNPHMAAFFAAREGQDAKNAQAAMGQGQSMLDRMITRSTQLSTAARPSDAATAAMQQVGKAKSGGGVLGTLTGLGKLGMESGLFGKAWDFFNKPDAPAYDNYAGQTGWGGAADYNRESWI